MVVDRNSKFLYAGCNSQKVVHFSINAAGTRTSLAPAEIGPAEAPGDWFSLQAENLRMQEALRAVLYGSSRLGPTAVTNC